MVMTQHDIYLFMISSFTGLVVGYVMGRVASSKHVGGSGGTGGTGGPGGTGGDPGGGPGGPGGVGGVGGEGASARQLWDHLPTIIGVILLILSVASIAMWSKTTSCQTEQNNELRQSLAARAAVSKGQNAAMRKLIQTSADPKATPEVKKDAVSDYLDALDDLDRAQQDNPLNAESC